MRLTKRKLIGLGNVHSGYNKQLYYCSKQSVCTKIINIVDINLMFIFLLELRAGIWFPQFVCLYSVDIFSLHNLTDHKYCTAKHLD